MRDRIAATGRRLLNAFLSFTPGQKAMTVFAVVALGVGGYFFSTWVSPPTYAPLFSNLAPADASAIVDKLTADGVPYQLTNGGQTITVPQDQVYAQRLKMSGAGLPAQSDSGYALLDKQGVMTSDFMQRVDYQRALEGELARTIKSINGVTAATVHLAIPQKDIFSNEQQQPTASVLVATSAGRKLTADQVQAVVHLVASSVEGLDPTRVTVVGADGMVLSGSGYDSGTGGGDQRTRATQEFQQRLGGSLQQMLDQLVGPGHAVVQVTADLDFDTTETRKETYTADPSTPPLSESKKSETFTGTGANPGGVVAPDTTPGPSVTGNGTYKNDSDVRNNAVGRVTEIRHSAPGAVRRLSVAVLLDSSTAKGADEAQLQQLVSSAVGLDAKRGDTIAVTTMPFDKSTADKAQQELSASTKADKQEQLYSMIRTGATVGAIVVLLLAAMIGGRRRNKRLQKLLRAEVAQLNAETADAIEPGGAPRAITADGGDATLAIEAPALIDPQLELRAERQREISELVEQQPDEVAQLLRGWLADRRG